MNTADRLRLALILCLATASTAWSSPAPEVSLVDAGSYRLNFKVIRGEGPVVLLEAGGGSDSSNWDALAPRIAEATGATVVSYDRPGFGASDLPDLPCDMREESQSMWRALEKLGLAHDVVAVGWSYGGWMSRLHASDRPDAVVGIVFVDAFNALFVDTLGVDYCDLHPMMGNLPFKDEPFDSLTREQQALVRMGRGGLGPKMAIMRETRLPAGIPVRVITSGQPFLPEARETELWRWAHETIVAHTPGAVLVVAEECNHGVPFQDPDLVLQQIRAVLAEID